MPRVLLIAFVSLSASCTPVSSSSRDSGGPSPSDAGEHTTAHRDASTADLRDAATSVDASPPLDAAISVDASEPPDAAISVDASEPPDAAVTETCPPPPAGLPEFSLPDGYGHPIAVRLASGQVGTMPLPLIPDDHASDQLSFGESAGGANTPSPVTVEISVSRCRGVIDDDTANFCNLRSMNGSYNSLVYVGRPYMTLDDAMSVNARGYCWAPSSEGPWFVNMRWTYTECAFGASTCGFMVQRNPGPF